jgi:hypothetical protein
MTKRIYDKMKSKLDQTTNLVKRIVNVVDNQERLLKQQTKN